MSIGLNIYVKLVLGLCDITYTLRRPIEHLVKPGLIVVHRLTNLVRRGRDRFAQIIDRRRRQLRDPQIELCHKWLTNEMSANGAKGRTGTDLAVCKALEGFA